MAGMKKLVSLVMRKRSSVGFAFFFFLWTKRVLKGLGFMIYSN